jgi:hypothetical protein
MAEIVLVYGVDQQQESADVREDVIGCPLWRGASALRGFPISPIAFGEIAANFRTPGQQGDNPESRRPWPWSGCATPGGPRKIRFVKRRARTWLCHP